MKKRERERGQIELTPPLYDPFRYFNEISVGGDLLQLKISRPAARQKFDLWTRSNYEHFLSNEENLQIIVCNFPCLPILFGIKKNAESVANSN